MTNCLANVTKLAGDAVLETLLGYSERNFPSPDFKARYTALIVIGIITEGANKASFIPRIMPAIPAIINMLTDKTAKVRSGAGFALCKICENFGPALKNKELIDNLVPIMLKSLQCSVTMCNYACSSIENIAIIVG